MRGTLRPDTLNAINLSTRQLKKIYMNTSTPLTFAIFGNEYQIHKSASISKILGCLEKHEADVCIDKAFYDFLVKRQLIDLPDVRVFSDSQFDADFVISMGGDGTLLKAASRVGDKQIPIIGVNMGRLGFLAGVMPCDIEDMVNDIFNGEYVLDRHAAIQVEVEGTILRENPLALNDIAVLKRDNASMISIRTCVNGEFLTNYLADGLIVATPTGSTAYSLSNGGPVIVPQTGILCLTPVAPHSLNARPVIISDDSVISLEVESRSHNFLVAIDGRSENLADDMRLTIRKASTDILIVKRKESRYFSTLRKKLMWGADPRR